MDEIEAQREEDRGELETEFQDDEKFDGRDAQELAMLLEFQRLRIENRVLKEQKEAQDIDGVV